MVAQISAGQGLSAGVAVGVSLGVGTLVGGAVGISVGYGVAPVVAIVAAVAVAATVGSLGGVGVGAGGAAVASRWVTAGLGGELLELAVGGLCFAVLVGMLIWTHPRDRAELAQTFAALTRTGR